MGTPLPNSRVVTPHLLIYICRSAFLAFNLFYYVETHNTEVRYSKQRIICFCFFRAFAPIFHFKLQKTDDKYFAPPEIFLASLAVLGWLQPCWLDMENFVEQMSIKFGGFT